MKELKMRRIPVILDCDNTMGVRGCDIDDGLTILFLLGCNEIDLIGITCSYGNSSQETVYRNTCRLIKDWGRSEIPVLRGAEDPEIRKSEAASFLAEKTRVYAGELCIIGTGSLTNLAGAAETDPAFFSNVRTISLMGGITEELFVGGTHMDELNFSCDPEASLTVISHGKDVRIATAQNSLHSFFGREEFNNYLGRNPGKLADMLRRETGYWFDLYEKKRGLPGFVNWDVMAAMQLTNPETLNLKSAVISPDIDSMREGLLSGNGEPITVMLPEITDHDLYFKTVYDSFFRAAITL